MPRCNTLLLLSLIGALSAGCARERQPAEKHAASNASNGLTSPVLRASDSPSKRRALTVPKGFVRVNVGAVVPTPEGDAVVLIHEASQRVVPIFIGETEALSIRLRLEHRRFERPLTHDLLDSMVKKLGGQIESVRVERLQNNAFFGIIVVRTTNNRFEVDSRSSDAVALAVGNAAPIFMSEAVLERAGRNLEEMDQTEEPQINAPVPL